MRSEDKQNPVVFLSGGAGFTAQDRVLEEGGAASSTARKQKTTYPEISHEHPECWVGRQQVATLYS